MYPSIIVGYKLCYMNVVTEERWLSDPNAELMYIPVGGDSSFAVVRKYNGENVRTIIPEIMNTVMELRKEVRKRKKQAQDNGDTFRAICLDFQQLSCKVFQNSVYGFFGVRRNSLLGYPLLMAGICSIGQYMIKTVSHLALRERCYVVYGDTDSVMIQFPDIPDDIELARKQLFLRAEKLAEKCTSKFPAPNELEVETLKFVFLLLKRKNYAAYELEAGPGGWNNKIKTSVKGLTFKKRDRCIWVRNIGHQVLKFILQQTTSKIIPFIETQVQALLDDAVPYSDLTITCWIKAEGNYKNASQNLIQLHTAKKLAGRLGVQKLCNIRLGYVITEGSGPLYARGEEARFAEAHNMRLDLQYYIEKQLGTSISNLLTHHSTILNMFQKFIHEAKLRGCFVRTRSLVRV